MGYPKDFFVRTGAERKAQTTIRDLEARQIRGSVLNPKQLDALETARITNRKASRRVFLGRSLTALAGTGSIVALTAVGMDAFGNQDKKLAEPNPTTVPKKPDATPQNQTQEKLTVVEDGKKRLFDLIDTLPASPIKQLFLDRIKPLYDLQGPFPKKFKSGEYEFDVWNPKVNTIYPPTITIAGGEYISSPDLQADYLPKPLVETLITHPLNSEIAPPDAPTVAKNFPDHTTPTQDTLLTGKVALANGMYPEISIKLGKDSTISSEKRETVKAFEDFLFLKEASSCIIELLLAEEMFNAMKKFNLPTSIPAQFPGGRIENTDFIWTLIQSDKSAGGRTLAAIDRGGAFLAFAALRGTKISEVLGRDKNSVESHIIDRVSGIQFGTTEADILLSTIHFSLNYPLSAELDRITAGDITLIP